MELIDSNLSIIKQFGIDIFSNKEKLLLLISKQYSFNDQRDPVLYRNILNTLLAYRSEYNTFEKLSIQYDNHLDKVKILEVNRKMLDDLKTQEIELSNKVSLSKSNLDKYSSLVKAFTDKTDIESIYKSKYEKKCDLEREISNIKSRLDEYTSKVGKSAQLLSQIKSYRDQIDILTNESKPITEEISKLTGQLTMLESYQNEYKIYKDQFDMVETLRKYCSPTNGGIQVLFMQLYMNKTLETSNQILSMLFNGDYRLLDFVINQNEFRIPFIGNGLPVDDISSGSSSQVCMMSMIINLVLLHEASTKFNIARLDEIDDSLDTYNRSNFVNVLYRILPLLDIEQLFIISHSIELDSSFADVIKLKSYEDYDTINSNNIIWDYREEIRE